MTDTKCGVHDFVNYRLFRLRFFGANNGMKKLSEFFPISSSNLLLIFSELKVDTETILPHKVRHGCRLLFYHRSFRHEV